MSRLARSVSLVIIIITISVFLLQNLSAVIFGFDLFQSLAAKINPLILRGQIWRFTTPIFLHGSFLHIAFNMYALYSIGPGLERKYGRVSFLLLYLISGIFGNVISFLLTPAASLGASTAIFGLIAAQGVYIYKNRHLLGSAARPLLMNILFMVAINLFLGLNPGIDNWGHLGGLLGGFLYAWFAGPTYGTPTILFGNEVIVREDKKVFIAMGILLALAAALASLGFLFN
jgi:rhomboid protease GluP